MSNQGTISGRARLFAMPRFLALAAALIAVPASSAICTPRAFADVPRATDSNDDSPFARALPAANTLIARGRLQDAEKVLKDLVASELARPEGPGSTAMAMFLLAQLQTQEGELPEAEANYRAADQAPGPPGTPPLIVATIGVGLAALLVDEGRPEEARQVIEPALTWERQPEVASDQSINLIKMNDDLALASIDSATGHYAEAADRLRTDLAEPGSAQAPTTSMGRIVLARLLQQEGKLVDSEQAYIAALSRLDNAGADIAGQERALGTYGLGVDLEREGRLREAELMIRTSLALTRRASWYPKGEAATSQTARALDAPSLQELGRLLRLQSNNAAAVAVDRQACGGMLDRANASSSLNVATSLGKVFKPSDDCQLETALSLKALADRSAANTFISGPPPVHAPGLTAADLSNTALHLDPPAAATDSRALLAEAFERAQRAQQSAAAEAVSEAAALVAAKAAGVGDVAQGYEQAVASSAKLEKILASGPDATLYSPLGGLSQQKAAEQLPKVQQQIADLARQLKARWPDYWNYRSPEPVELSVLQATAGGNANVLRANEAIVLLVYAPGADKGLTFVVGKRHAAWAEMTLTGDQLTAKVACLRAGLDPSSYGQEARQADCHPERGFDPALAHELYAALLGDPGVRDVMSDADTLLVVPSGPLTSLPPALLVVDSPTNLPPHWLVQDKAIAILPSVAALQSLRLQPRPVPSDVRPLLAFVDPNFNGDGATAGLNANANPFGPESLDLVGSKRAGAIRPIAASADAPPPEWAAAQSLPGTLAEGVDLANDLRAEAGSLVYGPAATRSAVFAHAQDNSLGEARVVVFATHGIFPGQFQGVDEPALLMARPQPPADGFRQNWLLSATDVTGLKLNADWVLLSACDTAAPGAVGAEGLSGLARAFFYAGARTLLVSHWLIRPEPARATIDETFRLLADPVGRPSKAQALRSAQLKLMGAYPDPREWAPFVVVGDPD
jgi:CHAT domain-containing protein